MENKLRLTRDSSEDIGFVKSCVIKGAITNKQFSNFLAKDQVFCYLINKIAILIYFTYIYCKKQYDS